MWLCRARVGICALVGVVVSLVVPLTGPSHAMADSSKYVARDLGTLGADRSEADAVDGPIVVGDSVLPNGAMHAFSFDLALPDGVAKMQDLGTLGGGWSEPYAVSGTIAVGEAAAR